MKKQSKAQKIDLELDNYLRQLEKDANALELVERHLKAHAVMNAALHCSEEVLPSPLYTQVVKTLEDIKKVIQTYGRTIPKFDAEDAKVE
jgi:hypothetical protein